MPVTTVKEFITVHGVNPKPFTKNGKVLSSGGLLVDPDKKIWVNTAPGMDMKPFQKGGNYEVEREILENGKTGNIISLVGFDEPAVTAKTTTSTGNGCAVIIDRDRKITLMNVGNVASNLALGTLDDTATTTSISDAFNVSFDVVKARYQKEGIL